MERYPQRPLIVDTIRTKALPESVAAQPIWSSDSAKVDDLRIIVECYRQQGCLSYLKWRRS